MCIAAFLVVGVLLAPLAFVTFFLCAVSFSSPASPLSSSIRPESDLDFQIHEANFGRHDEVGKMLFGMYGANK